MNRVDAESRPILAIFTQYVLMKQCSVNIFMSIDTLYATIIVMATEIRRNVFNTYSLLRQKV